MTLLDMAHLEGFNRSVQDVTLARLLQFGLAPALKQNFEEIQRAPYLARLALVEICPDNSTRFFRVNYDGHWETFPFGTIIGGHPKMVEWIEKELQNQPFATYSIDQALKAACQLWEQSKKQIGENEEDGGPKTLKEAFESWVVEGAVLSHNTSRKSLYRSLTRQEIETLKTMV